MQEFKYKMVLAYVGTHYSGWQRQPNGLSIQEVIEKAMYTLLKMPCHLVGSGRTDAGVHAYGQVAHFVVPQKLNIYKFLHSMNGLLPLDIRIKSMSEVSLDFHACHSAIAKIYQYHVHYDKVANPFTHAFCWHIREKLDLHLLKAATSYFIGTHDFTSFANEAYRGSAARNPVRTIHRIEILPADGALCLEFEGNGFLYKMVRNMVGTLVSVAMGKRELETLPQIFAAKDRCRADAAAPPQGLFLAQVFYPSVFDVNAG